MKRSEMLDLMVFHCRKLSLEEANLLLVQMEKTGLLPPPIEPQTTIYKNLYNNKIFEWEDENIEHKSGAF